MVPKYWISDEYKQKRQRAQECSMSSEDTAQNRGGSRNFSETQQFLEHTFGPENSGTLNTYAVMKSGYKSVDKTGRNGPIPSHKAQRRLDAYKELAPDENSHELDGKALYTIGHGMKHGHVPIGNGAVDKATVLVHGKSMPFKPIYPDDYQRVLKENEQLKQTNEILSEENSVNRELIMTGGHAHGGSRLVDGDRRSNENSDESYHDESYHEDDDANFEGNDDGDPNLECDAHDKEAVEDETCRLPMELGNANISK